MKKTNIILVTALALFCFVAEKASAQYWILPKASNGTSTAWSYMEASLDDGLAAGYQSTTFDYSSWAVGQSGFGINAYKKDWYGTIYSGAQGLWIRKKVTLDVQDLSSLTFELIYDEDPVIYINGTEVYRTTGWHDGSFKDITSTIDKTTLNLQGDNEIAIHFVPGGGGSCLDFSIFCTEEPPTLDAYITDAMASLATITPENHHDNTGDKHFLLGNERTSVDGLATSKDALANLQAALDVIEAAHAAGKTKSQVPDELAALAAAKAIVDAKSNPLVDGYYYLVAEYDANTAGVPGGFVIGSNEDGIAKVAYNETNLKQMFNVEYDAANGKVYLQNVANGKYLGVVDGSAWKFSDDRISLNVMTGNDHNWYWGADRTVAARSCSFILSDAAGKGISSANCGVANDVTNTASQAWVISWAFRPADEYYADYIANGPLKTAIENLADAYATIDFGTNPGEYAQAGVEAFKALYADYVTAYNGGDNTLSAAEQQDMADALNEAYTTATTNRNPLTDGYYVIKSAAAAFGDNEYAMYIDDNAKVAWKAYDEDAIGQFVFQLTDQDATVTPDGVTYEVFSYYNVAQKKYIGQCSTQMVYEDASTSDEVWGACAQTLTPEGQFVIQPMWNLTTVSFCLTVDNTSNTSGIVRTSGWYGGYSAGNNNGSWKFERVDLEAVTIGATGYSTFVSDKALVIPTGVTVYGVTGIDGTEVELTQLSGTVLAANEPVILAGEADLKYYFVASDDAGSSIAGNLLEGTGTTGKSIGENEAYVLYNNEGTAVFRIAGAMVLPAHKAYLPAAVVGGAGTKEFSIGGITGIKSAANGANGQSYYDMQGRKVAAPQKGQIYIMGGKKVLY